MRRFLADAAARTDLILDHGHFVLSWMWASNRGYESVSVRLVDFRHADGLTDGHDEDFAGSSDSLFWLTVFVILAQCVRRPLGRAVSSSLRAKCGLRHAS